MLGGGSRFEKKGLREEVRVEGKKTEIDPKSGKKLFHAAKKVL